MVTLLTRTLCAADAEKAAEGPESIAADTGTNEPSEVEKKIKVGKRQKKHTSFVGTIHPHCEVPMCDTL